MPDDKDLEIAEQEPVDDAESSFDEDDKPEVDENGDIIEDDPDKKDDPGEKAEKKKAGDQVAKEKADETPKYSDELDKRIKTIDDDSEDAEAEKVAKEKKEVDDKAALEKKEAADKVAKVDTGEFGDLDDIDLPDKNIKVGGIEVNLKEYKEDYPDDYAAATVLATRIAKKIVAEVIDERLKGVSKVGEAVAQLADRVSDSEFWGAITEVHPDAKKVNADPKFTAWLKKQDAPIQRIAQNMSDPADGIMVLNYYKATETKGDVDKLKKTAADKKKKTDDLHKGTMRSKPTVKKSGGADPDDAEASFNEDD